MDVQPTALIGRHVYVVPKQQEQHETVVGILQQPLFNDDWYVRDSNNDLCGPYEDDEINLPLTSGIVVEHKGDSDGDSDVFIVVYNQGAIPNDSNPDVLAIWRFDPTDYSRTWKYTTVKAKDVRPYGEEGMKNLQATRPDYWLRSLTSEAAAIKDKYWSIW